MTSRLAKLAALMTCTLLTACAVEDAAPTPEPESETTQAVTDWCQVLENCCATSIRDNNGSLIRACFDNFSSLCFGGAQP